MGAADDLLDRVIRHAVWLERLKAHEARELVELLDRRAFRGFLDRLPRFLSRHDTGPGVIESGSFRSEFNGVLRELTDDMRGALSGLRERLVDIAKTESAWIAQRTQAILPPAVSFQGAPAAALRAAIASRPFTGKLMRDWVSGLTGSTRAAVAASVRRGIAEGQSVGQMVRAIRGTEALRYRDGILRLPRQHAETWVRTAINHSSAAARQATGESNRHVVKRLQWVSVLDTRTTVICASRDGKTWPIDSGPRPPAHPRCRSTITYVMKSWKELGINLAEAPPGTRATMDGQAPATLTYQDWLRNQPLERQVEVLGKARAALFRSGKLDDLAQLVSASTGKPWTLAELATREGLDLGAILAS